ncbi:MAG: acetyl-CoA carboxylase biotin carboxyl carrier protein, partial [Candidatus Angelobacter sp.]
MNQRELKELIEFLIEKDITEFELERGDVKVRIKRGVEVAATAAISHMPIAAMPMNIAPSAAGHVPATPVAAPASSAPPAAPPVEEELHIVKSPIVGTYYESPAPGAPPFLKPGDTVQTGQVLCIVEAMKLMNEIES